MKDPNTRQAYIAMNNYHHAFNGNKDFVCTKGISFRLNEGALDIHVSMRSSDLVYGVGTDLPCFWTLWLMMARALNKPTGRFIFSTDSLHIYERHYEMSSKLLDAGPKDRVGFEFPKLDDHIDLIHLQFKSDFGLWLAQAPL
jgi:thymidylate synthase